MKNRRKIFFFVLASWMLSVLPAQAGSLWVWQDMRFFQSPSHFEYVIQWNLKRSQDEGLRTHPAVSVVEFYLHPGLLPKLSIGSNLQLSPCAQRASGLGEASCWRIFIYDPKVVEVSLHVIQQPSWKGDEETFIKPGEGGVLIQPALWLPYKKDVRVQVEQFQAQVEDSHWQIIHAPLGVPLDGFYLIFQGGFKYEQTLRGVGPIAVILKQEDSRLAQSLIQEARRAFDQYLHIFGAYPFSGHGFAIVENPWYPSGYGLAGATWIGSQVLRLPVFLSSSLPHEILHNWWGNSVYVDASQGNWSEGLTTYMSDYAQIHSEADKKDYRLAQNLRYQWAFYKQTQIPLKEFRYRFDEASQALGYSKSMLLFHEIKEILGEKKWLTQLKQIFSDFLWQDLSFSSLLESLMAQSHGLSRSHALDLWSKPGQPKWELLSAKKTRQSDGRWLLSYRIGQHPNPYYYPGVLFLSVQTSQGPQGFRVEWNAVPEQSGDLLLNHEPIELALDPDFHSFRWVWPDELSAQFYEWWYALQVLFVAQDTTKAQDISQLWLAALKEKSSQSPRVVSGDEKAWLENTLGNQSPFSYVVFYSDEAGAEVLRRKGFALQETWFKSSTPWIRLLVHPQNQEKVWWYFVPSAETLSGRAWSSFIRRPFYYPHACFIESRGRDSHGEVCYQHSIKMKKIVEE